MVTFEEFKKLELKVATIKNVQDHPNADKLYVLEIELGDITKQIVAGIKLQYTKEELLNKQIVIVNNLEPVILRGVQSDGMLLAASDENTLAVLCPDRKVVPGAIVR